ncbi:MAG: UDP-4-amino-4,6-dideoxy-N-acetyl-beta-L-altrosamine transaminase [Epsilonproteobacteria bacterium]|nr:MAG: UDP-4-amino-4,6-dideoxy-N-acetyl-beta-L-altrosamine transaminase [Campylobacterota bacterium]
MLPYGRQWIDEQDIAAVVEVLNSDWITTGAKVDEFEKDLCTYLGTDHAVAVNSGTSALDIAVQSLDIPPCSEIITSPFTFVATSNSILYNNCKPVFADIEGDTRNINPEEIRKKITEKTKAIIYVDYAGHPCEIKEMQEIAEENDLFLIEDACHALGAEYHGRRIGSFADMTVFSFHPVKHITTGEGGAVTTNNDKFYEKLKMLRNHGIDKPASDRHGSRRGWGYDMKYLGRNYRITDFQCALGISQLKKLDDFIKTRRHIARTYTELLDTVDFIELPHTRENVKHAWHLYTILLEEDRNNFFKSMRKRNVGVNIHYIPTYRFSYYQKHFNINPKEFPITEEVFNKIITLPLFPKMTDSDILAVVDAINILGDLR